MATISYDSTFECEKCTNFQSYSIYGQEFCFVPEELNYADAQKACNEYSGILFEPKDIETNNDVFRRGYDFLETDNIWIGLNDINEDER